MFLRLSIPWPDSADTLGLAERRLTSNPEPVYGGQLQKFSAQGIPTEGEMTVSYVEQTILLDDCETTSLRIPEYAISDPGYGLLHPGTMMSPRIAPPVIGIGLLEAIPEDSILAGADPEDRDGDGISGRPNWVWSDEYYTEALGRFGWKAGQRTLAQQAAAAFRGDIGIATSLYPVPWGNCTDTQTICRAAWRDHGSWRRRSQCRADGSSGVLHVQSCGTGATRCR